MKFARVNGQRQEAQPDHSGECCGCGNPVNAKCGKQRVWHWAHIAGRVCDSWWEPETEWHRAWKSHFPADWQEIPQHAEDGELHIADVKTGDGWVLEFQHSPIQPGERESRETFYKSMIWVVDGRRRIKDVKQFSRAWAAGESRFPLVEKRRIASPKGALLEEWAGSRAHVFFDFGEEQLWWLFPASDDQRAYVRYISRGQFVGLHRQTTRHGPTEFDALVQNFGAYVGLYEPPPPTHRPQRPPEIPYFKPTIGRRFRF